MNASRARIGRSHSVIYSGLFIRYALVQGAIRTVRFGSADWFPRMKTRQSKFTSNHVRPRLTISMNLANKLTVSRIAVIPFFLVAVVPTSFALPAYWEPPLRVLALLLFIGASITDYYDGVLA